VRETERERERERDRERQRERVKKVTVISFRNLIRIIFILDVCFEKYVEVQQTNQT